MSEPTIVARIPFVNTGDRNMADYGCSVGIDTEGRAWFCNTKGHPMWWTETEGIAERAAKVRRQADLKVRHAEMVEAMSAALAANPIVVTA